MMLALMLVPIVVYFGHRELLDPTALTTVYEYTDAASGAVVSCDFGGGIFSASWQDIVSGLGWGLGYFGMPHILVRFMSIEKPSMIKKSSTVAIIWVIISLFSAVLIAYFGRMIMGAELLADGSQKLVFIAMSRKFFPAAICGLLLAAILSDTLVFRSPTCTPVDVSTAHRLAKIAGVEIDAFASEMFEAGEKLDGKTPEEVFLQDFKVFMCGDVRFGVAQGSYMTRKNLKAAQQLLTPYLPEACGKQNVEDLYMLLTDVPKEESVVICTGRHAGEMLRSGFEKEPEEDGSWVLPGVVSRKKQFIPALMSAYQEL